MLQGVRDEWEFGKREEMLSYLGGGSRNVRGKG